MNTTKMKALAVNTAMALVLGVGATALFMPSIENAVVQHRTDDQLAHIRQSRTHDPVSTVSPAKQGAGDTVGNPRHGGTDPTVSPAGGIDPTVSPAGGTTPTVSPNEHGGTEPTVSPHRHGGTEPTVSPHRHGGTEPTVSPNRHGGPTPTVSPNKHGGTGAVGHG